MRSISAAQIFGAYTGKHKVLVPLTWQTQTPALLGVLQMPGVCPSCPQCIKCGLQRCMSPMLLLPVLGVCNLLAQTA